MDCPRSPDSDNARPPASPNHSSPPQPSFENGDRHITSIRFLISNAAAGSVIGKGGTTINDFQSQSGAKIQLSRNHEFFPGTTDRIVVLIGDINEVLVALHLILSKLSKEAEGNAMHESRSNHIKLIVPNIVCGAIIGKGGSTIKAVAEDSQANIKLSPQEQLVPGLNDRIITVTGSLNQQLRAIALILAKISEDSSYAQYSSAPLSYPASGSGASLLGIQNLRGRFAAAAISPPAYGGTQHGTSTNNSIRSKGIISSSVASKAAPSQISLPLPQPSPATTSVTLFVPDERVGAIVGRAGKTITDIQQTSGAHIKISDRGDFVAGTHNRKVTITGTADGVRLAQHLLTQRVQQAFGTDFER